MKLYIHNFKKARLNIALFTNLAAICNMPAGFNVVVLKEMTDQIVLV